MNGRMCVHVGLAPDKRMLNTWKSSQKDNPGAHRLQRQSASDAGASLTSVRRMLKKEEAGNEILLEDKRISRRDEN